MELFRTRSRVQAADVQSRRGQRRVVTEGDCITDLFFFKNPLSSPLQESISV